MTLFSSARLRALYASSAIVGAMAFAAPANAAVSLVMGDNSLTTQIHALNGQDPKGYLVKGVTKKPDGTVVNFSSDDIIKITGGSGYASISDFNQELGIFDDLTIALENGGVFTGYEFSIQMLNKFEGDLLISYVLGSGGTGSFFYNGTTGDSIATSGVLSNLRFKNSSTTDFRLIASGGDTIRSIKLTTNGRFDQLKQNDINLAAPVPEPGTWALMLLGFGAIGASMRRRRSSRLLQLA